MHDSSHLAVSTSQAPVGAQVAWEKKDEWWAHGKNFLVVVKRHELTRTDEWEGPHRWAVYAYVYPKHRHYANFKGEHMWQPAASCMPFHGYPSLLRWHYDERGEPTSVQVGADYNHLHDDRFTRDATKEDAHEVFADAEELFRWLVDSDAPAADSPPVDTASGQLTNDGQMGNKESA
jgi:hypothetical protein